jgi:hypothetical protein
LIWWRTRSAKDYEVRDIQTLRDSLRDISKSKDSQWKRAIRGDADAAIGVAVRLIWRREKVGVSRDAAMSAVLACALEHDPAATFLLSAALDRRARAHPDDAALAGSWLISSVTS